MVGDIIELNRFMDAKGNAIRVKIVGVFTNKEADDTYWVQSPSDYYSSGHRYLKQRGAMQEPRLWTLSTGRVHSRHLALMLMI